MSDTNLTLSLSFDADQTSSLLFWETLPNCSPTKGIYAGMLALQAQIPLNVVVSGLGIFDNPNGPALSGFEIKDFSIISRPDLVACGPNDPVPSYSPPSPFNGTYVATKNFQWDGTQRSQSTEKYLVIRDSLNAPLQLGELGSWSLTIMLTILIQRVDGSSSLRVFYADIDTVLYAPQP
jgi:hypothetical protein